MYFGDQVCTGVCTGSLLGINGRIFSHLQSDLLDHGKLALVFQPLLFYVIRGIYSEYISKFD